MISKPIRLVVSGCCGRMGSLVLEEASHEPERFTIVAGIERPDSPYLGKPHPTLSHLTVEGNLKAALKKADLLIEFTTPEASVEHAALAAQARIPMIIGTTGFSEDQFDRLKNLAREIPIFWSPNMSIGIVILRKTIGSLFELCRKFNLEANTSIRISETHHAKKRDTPSGTAKLLAEEIQKVTHRTISDHEIEAKREGEVVGLHSVTFDFGAERIRLEHEAIDRRLFARGALLVAKNFSRVRNRPAGSNRPGWYGMDDLITGHGEPFDSTQGRSAEP